MAAKNYADMFAIIENVCKEFRIKGKMIGFEEITIGNVNFTYRVNFDTNKSYVLQRVNTNVFKEPRHIMSNIDFVTTYIRNRAKELNPDAQELHFYHMMDGSNYCFADDDSFWRICNHIDSVTYNTFENMDMLCSAGKAFGTFQMNLLGFDSRKLYETIPDFHNTKKRLDQFFADVERDPFGRVSEVVEEIAYIRSVREKASILSELTANKELPLRVTHNDTKGNNVLFDKVTNEPLGVIDLDTVMPGLVAHDYGDAIRSSASSTDEDETDLSKVYLNLEKFEAFTKGFVGVVAPVLTQKEIDTLALGAFTIAVELGVRFLNDYINGDTYFKIRREKHNLERARCQLTLAKDMDAKQDEMQRIVHAVVEQSKIK